MGSVNGIGFSVYWVVFGCFVVGMRFGGKYIKCVLLWFIDGCCVVVLLWKNVCDGVGWWFINVVGWMGGGWI